MEKQREMSFLFFLSFQDECIKEARNEMMILSTSKRSERASGANKRNTNLRSGSGPGKAFSRMFCI